MGTQAFRLAAASAAAFLIVSALIVGALFWQTNTLLTDHVVDELHGEAAELARESQDLDTAALAGKDRISERSRHRHGPLCADGCERKASSPAIFRALPTEIADSPTGGVFRYPRAGDPPGFERLGVGYPRCGRSRSPPARSAAISLNRSTFAARVKRTFLWGFGALALAAMIAGLAMGRSVLSRIEVINATSRSIMGGDLSRRIPLSGRDDELDDLSRQPRTACWIASSSS